MALPKQRQMKESQTVAIAWIRNVSSPPRTLALAIWAWTEPEGSSGRAGHSLTRSDDLGGGQRTGGAGCTPVNSSVRIQGQRVKLRLLPPIPPCQF